MNSGDSPARVPQEQRRQAMQARIVEAAIDSLVELGYAGSSTIAISQRAGVSQGAIFRHFPTRAALMAVVADKVGTDLILSFQQRFAQSPSDVDPIRRALTLLRENCRAPVNQAWFELLHAARTDPDLRQTLEPIWQRNVQLTRQLAEAILPDLARLSPDFPVVVDLLVTLFHGEAMDDVIRADGMADASRFAMAELICKLLEQHYRTRVQPQRVLS